MNLYRLSHRMWCLLWVAAAGCLLQAAMAPFSVGAARPSQEQDATSDVRVAGEWHYPQLIVAGRIVFAQLGVHLGRPQISPDGSVVALAAIPAGTETADLAQTYLFARDTGSLLDQFAGHSPQWQDNRQLIYVADGRRTIYDREIGRSLQDPASDTVRQPAASLALTAPAVEYPVTIRVAHHPQNTCRDVPDWQVDEIPFEEYVKRSVPAEMPASWPIEALKAQAVAARTYAWYKILTGPVYTPADYGQVAYDVTDWANFQMMCNNDGPYAAKIEAVVEATAGQYLSSQRDGERAPIIAMYSAQNSHPTLTNPNVSYLRSVPDLYGLGKARFGHGYGLSQWGALDRANAGHTYRQILGHYYTGVDLNNALDPAQVLGGLLGIVPNGFVSPSGIRWNVLGPAAPVESKIVAHKGDAEPLTLEGRRGVWRSPALALEGEPVTVSLWLANSLQETISLRRDRTPPPAPTLILPESSETPTVSLTVHSSAADQIGLHSGWVWQAETLDSTTGTIAGDADADGQVRLARAGEDQPGFWYGPYTADLPPQATYRALFRLRLGGSTAHAIDTLLPDAPVARLDVTDRRGALRLGLLDIWASDFPAGETFVEIPVDFYIFEPASSLEFRVQWYGDVDLAFDRVEVFRLLAGGQRTLSWTLPAGDTAEVTAVAFDTAGNLSARVMRSVRIVDEYPPTVQSVQWPQGWQTALPVTVTATLIDQGSGLDFERSGISLDGVRQPVSFSNGANPWASQQLVATLSDVSEGDHLLTLTVADLLGQVWQSPPKPLRVDLSRPLPSAQTVDQDGSPLTATGSWFTSPLWVALSGEDAISGLQALAYVHNGAPFVLYTEPFAVTTEGQHSVRYWAQDRAGNYSLSHYLNFGIDLAPPEVKVWPLAVDDGGVTVAWQIEDTGSGVAAVEIEVQDQEGVWQPIDPEGGSSVYVAVDGGSKVGVRVRAGDHAGHTSDWEMLLVPRYESWLYLPQMSSENE